MASASPRPHSFNRRPPRLWWTRCWGAEGYYQRRATRRSRNVSPWPLAATAPPPPAGVGPPHPAAALKGVASALVRQLTARRWAPPSAASAPTAANDAAGSFPWRAIGRWGGGHSQRQVPHRWRNPPPRLRPRRGRAADRRRGGGDGHAPPPCLSPLDIHRSAPLQWRQPHAPKQHPRLADAHVVADQCHPHAPAGRDDQPA